MLKSKRESLPLGTDGGRRAGRLKLSNRVEWSRTACQRTFVPSPKGWLQLPGANRPKYLLTGLLYAFWVIKPFECVSAGQATLTTTQDVEEKNREGTYRIESE
jgi:hypothetical protein